MGHYIGNSSIMDPSSQIMENHRRFFNQDQQPATKLILSLNYHKQKRFYKTKYV
jgi:hypothetical protein